MPYLSRAWLSQATIQGNDREWVHQLGMQKDDQSKVVFTEQSMENIHAYIDTLKRIAARLYAEGYIIKDGKLVPLGYKPEPGNELIIEW